MGNVTFGQRSDKALGGDVDMWFDCAGGSADCEGTEAGSTGCGAAGGVGICGFSSSTDGGAGVGSAATGVPTLAVPRVAMLRLALARLVNFPAFPAARAA